MSKTGTEELTTWHWLTEDVHTQSCDSVVKSCLLHPRHKDILQGKMGKACPRTRWALRWVTAQWLSQQHTWSPGPLHSQQTSNVCIQQGCTAAPHSLSTKWWHPFLHAKHGGEEEPLNPDLPPERHPRQHDSSHKHLRDHVWNFWASQRQSLCHTKSGPAHTKLRRFGIFLTPCLVFVFSDYLLLHKARESSEAPALGEAQQTDLVVRDQHVTTRPVTAGSAQTKKENNNNKKKDFKWVCTKTFQKSFFHEGFKINRTVLLLWLLTDSSGQKNCNGMRRQKAKFISDVSKKTVQSTARTVTSPYRSECDPQCSKITAADHSDETMVRLRHLH